MFVRLGVGYPGGRGGARKTKSGTKRQKLKAQMDISQYGVHLVRNFIGINNMGGLRPDRLSGQ